MSQIDKHLIWCLKDEKKLRIKPDLELAKAHLAKSEYNKGVMKILEDAKKYDWALNVGFYTIYHCFLAILAKHGYASRNQSCTATAILTLIEEKRIELDKALVLQFDTLEMDKEATDQTIRESREISTYGVKTEINTKQLYIIKAMITANRRSSLSLH